MHKGWSFGSIRKQRPRSRSRDATIEQASTEEETRGAGREGCNKIIDSLGEGLLDILDWLKELHLGFLYIYKGTIFAGLHSLATPTGLDRWGLPMGMQLVGHRFEESTLLRTGPRSPAGQRLPPTHPLIGSANGPVVGLAKEACNLRTGK